MRDYSTSTTQDRDAHRDHDRDIDQDLNRLRDRERELGNHPPNSATPMKLDLIIPVSSASFRLLKEAPFFLLSVAYCYYNV
jgi:hypothetical protein